MEKEGGGREERTEESGRKGREGHNILSPIHKQYI